MWKINEIFALAKSFRCARAQLELNPIISHARALTALSDGQRGQTDRTESFVRLSLPRCFFTFLYQFAIFFTHFQVAGADPSGGGSGGDGDGAAR